MKQAKIIIPIIYLILCIIISFNRIPFWDEARAWLIIQNCNFVEFLSMMKLECHLSLWFLAILPFAKLNLFYPYSIYIINSLFAFFAILILWLKSPFNNLQKILITFGVPFLLLWGVVARCYSIGIFFLFLALSIYKKRKDFPFKYLILLCLSSQCSVMAFIGSFYLSILFLYENYKNKNFLKLLLIFFVSSMFVFIQVYDPNPDYLKQLPEMMFLRDFIWYLLLPVFFIKAYPIQSILMSVLKVNIIIMTFMFIFFSLKNYRKILFFIIPTYVSMIILFTYFYSGNFWHYFFFYLYFIVSMWILKENTKIPKKMEIVFTIILFMFIFRGSLFIDSKLTTINDSNSYKIAENIELNYKNNKIFCLDPWSDIVPSSLPLIKNNIIYDKNNQDRKSFQSMRNQIKFNLELFDPDDFSKYVDDNSILITTKSFLNHEIKNPKREYDAKTGIISFVGKNNTVKFIPNKSNEDINLYSYLIKINN